MGLSAPRNRVKLSSDPNNTNWSRSTERFGHKILTTYGWEPGAALGAENAAQAAHYTSANFSHVRAVLKDDTRGLGCNKKSAAENDTFGLNLFQNVLGRLNGKDDGQLEKDAKQLRDVNLRLYQEKAFGTMIFVHGGFLVGDRVERSLPTTTDRKRSSTEEKEAPDGKSGAIESTSRRKRKRGAESADASSSERNNEEPRGSKSNGDGVSEMTGRQARDERKRQRKARRELREKKREEKRNKKRRKDGTESTEKGVEPVVSGTSTPLVLSSHSSGTSTPISNPNILAGGRQELRRRSILQKRMAMSSQTALNEVGLKWFRYALTMLTLFADIHAQGRNLSV
ncbi:hypothetical protein P152DRAFT_248113 [Eremomyces bilateralis CBS 781.70]|uniref:PinX1-related protein 1 n=1 Tax=Eremomyces bilateralis CBS 781.70 TaxID=1392243 RepID=A0A6G1GB96_9PEZI|nr:uncharacterized protein P152DRAFT_248113 [Eremomyces bilateralis CBS 781.70]KAF1815180.1 hypothetical protein P152DRAFT_248113 [Eremomyces bilateralis CBS 781.70]